MVIVTLHFDGTKERLHRQRAPGIALLQWARRLLVGKELRVGKQLGEQRAPIALQRGPELFFQPMRAAAQRLLACQPLAR